MAVDDLTITSQRSQVVDFSVPYQTSTLQILIKVKKKNEKNEKKIHNFFFQKSELKSRGMGIQSFFDPFSGHLWVCILVAYVMVSIFMFVIGRVTPYERHAPQDGKGNTLTLANSFWFTLSAFFLRPTTISPKVRLYFFFKVMETHALSQSQIQPNSTWRAKVKSLEIYEFWKSKNFENLRILKI